LQVQWVPFRKIKNFTSKVQGIIHHTGEDGKKQVLASVPREKCPADVGERCTPEWCHCYDFCDDSTKCPYMGIIHLTNGVDEGSKIQVECKAIDFMKK